MSNVRVALGDSGPCLYPLRTCQGGAPTASLSDLFHSLAILITKNLFILSNWSMSCCNLCPLIPVLLLCTSGEIEPCLLCP